jgi:hypothetical protein
MTQSEFTNTANDYIINGFIGKRPNHRLAIINPSKLSIGIKNYLDNEKYPHKLNSYEEENRLRYENAFRDALTKLCNNLDIINESGSTNLHTLPLVDLDISISPFISGVIMYLMIGSPRLRFSHIQEIFITNYIRNALEVMYGHKKLNKIIHVQ